MAPLLARRPACDRTFERLYRRHAADVYRYALALLRDPTEAEDATQTAFMNAYRALVGGEEPRAPKAWLLTIVHNVCRMRRRSLARRPREVPLDDHPIAAVDDERPNLDAVLAALAELPLNQRAALVMREVEGRSYREISDVLGVSTSAVEALIFRARRRLRVRRDALGALAAAPLPASLGALPGGVIASAVGSDLVLKAAAGVVAMLLAGGAAYQAATGTTAEGATAAGRKHAPVMRRVLLATPLSARSRRAEQHAQPAQEAVSTRHVSTTILIVRTHRRAAQPPVREQTTGITKQHVTAPATTRPVTQPQRPRSSPRRHRLRARHRNLTPLRPVTVPSVTVPAVPTVQLPTVSTPQLPTVTVPPPPAVPTLPPPPPLPKIP